MNDDEDDDIGRFGYDAVPTGQCLSLDSNVPQLACGLKSMSPCRIFVLFVNEKSLSLVLHVNTVTGASVLKNVNISTKR